MDAFAKLFNVRNEYAGLVCDGAQVCSCGKQADMHWQGFVVKRKVTSRGAVQPARVVRFALVIGNCHIVHGFIPHTEPQKKRTVNEFSECCWREFKIPGGEESAGQGLPTVRILCGDVNLKKNGLQNFHV